jgi:hypothetical protein
MRRFGPRWLRWMIGATLAFFMHPVHGPQRRQAALTFVKSNGTRVVRRPANRTVIDTTASERATGG